MNYAIKLLEKNKKYLERNIKKTELMRTNMDKATQELHKITSLKKAIKFLKHKSKNQ